MLQTYIVYIGTLVLSWLLAFLADKYNNKKLIWGIILLLTAVAGLRGYTVGIDTYPYYSKFKLIAAGQFHQAYGLEESFKYFCYILMKIINDPTFVFVVLAFITNSCLILRAWDFRRIASFSCVVACYYMGFFFMTMNVMRQFVAVAIVVYATKYLCNKKYFFYIIGILIAMLFHRSACVAFAFFGIELLDWKSFTRKQQAFFGAFILLLPIVIYFVMRNMARYEGYMQNANVDIGMMVFVKLLFLIATLIFVFGFRGNGNYLLNENGTALKEKRLILLISVSYLIGLFFALSSYVFPALNRMAWYFTIFESAYMGMLMKTRQPLNKIIFLYCILFLVGLGFISAILGNSQGTVPYTFFWQ